MGVPVGSHVATDFPSVQQAEKVRLWFRGWLFLTTFLLLLEVTL